MSYSEVSVPPATVDAVNTPAETKSAPLLFGSLWQHVLNAREVLQ